MNTVEHEESYTADDTNRSERFSRAMRGLDKPKPKDGKPFHGITIDERRKRAAMIESCVYLGMTPQQISDFLLTWGVKLSRSQVYEYLSGMKLPRGYKTADQSHHDYYTLYAFIRIAEDAAKAGFQTSMIDKGSPVPGMRFRPDMAFNIGRYKFYLEMQLSDLPETRWRTKFSNYLRLHERKKERFRTLFVIDQDRPSLSYTRFPARQLLKERGSDFNPYLFIRLKDLTGSRNLATEKVWMDARGQPHAMLEYL